jgi:hypothetical protein
MPRYESMSNHRELLISHIGFRMPSYSKYGTYTVCTGLTLDCNMNEDDASENGRERTKCEHCCCQPIAKQKSESNRKDRWDVLGNAACWPPPPPFLLVPKPQGHMTTTSHSRVTSIQECESRASCVLIRNIVPFLVRNNCRSLHLIHPVFPPPKQVHTQTTHHPP